jgi:hypothetical protein
MEAVMEQIERMQETQEEWFLKACCERDPTAWVRPAKLYSAYASWCEEHELRPLSITQVAPIWKRLGLRRTVVHGYPRYWGVRLLVEGEEKLSFNRWLIRQRRRTDLVGTLDYDAYNYWSYRGWPKGRHALEVYAQYLEGLGVGWWALDPLQLAWEEWLEYRAEGDC